MKTTYQIKHFFGTAVFFSLIFISAGKLIYWQGWLYVAIGFIMMILSYSYLKIDKDLQNERAQAAENTKKWDKNILLLSFISTLAMYILAGLDSGRLLWSPRFHILFYIFGAALTASGQLIFLIAQKQNKFFSSTVRIQHERKHTVYQDGLYSFVRHPAYLGSIIQTIGFPLIFGSLWSLIPVAISFLLQIVRTSKEDKFLIAELDGYEAYCQNTKYKIFPYIW